MSSSNVRLVVSVQAHGFEDKPWEGHLATGVLVEPGTVLVPSAPDGIAEATEGIDLLVLPLPLGDAGRVERLVGVSVVFGTTLPDGRGGPFAAIRMANDSRHEPGIAEFTRCRLDEALEQHGGDLWAALETVGAVPAGGRDAITPELLREVPAVEAAQRRPVIERPIDDPAEGPCQWLPPCKKEA